MLIKIRFTSCRFRQHFGLYLCHSLKSSSSEHYNPRGHPIVPPNPYDHPYYPTPAPKYMYSHRNGCTLANKVSGHSHQSGVSSSGHHSHHRSKATRVLYYHQKEKLSFGDDSYCNRNTSTRTNFQKSRTPSTDSLSTPKRLSIPNFYLNERYSYGEESQSSTKSFFKHHKSKATSPDAFDNQKRSSSTTFLFHKKFCSNKNQSKPNQYGVLSSGRSFRLLKSQSCYFEGDLPSSRQTRPPTSSKSFNNAKTFKRTFNF